MLCAVNKVELKSSLLPPYGSNHISTIVDSLEKGKFLLHSPPLEKAIVLLEL